MTDAPKETLAPRLDGGLVDDAGFDPFGRDPSVERKIAPLTDALLDRFFRVHLEGAEHLPAAGKGLLVANHGGALPWDAFVLHAALLRQTGRAVRPLVEDPVIAAPFLGTFLTRLGCVRASQDNAVRLLARDELAAVFPEGMQGLGKLYRRRHKLARFGRGGFVRLAKRTKTLVYPTAIVGSEDTAPLLAKLEAFFRGNELLPYLPITPLFPLLGPLGLLPLPARWRIKIGAPIDVDALVPDEADTAAVSATASQIRETIQNDVDTLLSERGPTFF